MGLLGLASLVSSPEGHSGIGDNFLLPPRVTFGTFVPLLMGFRLTGAGSLSAITTNSVTTTEIQPRAVSDCTRTFDQNALITFRTRRRTNGGCYVFSVILASPDRRSRRT